MKLAPLALLLPLLLGGIGLACKPSSGTSDGVVGSESPSEVESVDGSGRAFPDAEFYIKQYSVGGTVEGSAEVEGMGRLKVGVNQLICGTTGEIPYSMEPQLAGSSEGQDDYDINISFLVAGQVRKKGLAITYLGTDLEFWRDDDYCMGVRPRTE